MAKERVALYGDVIQWQNDGVTNNLADVQAIASTPHTSIADEEGGYSLFMYAIGFDYWSCIAYPGDYLLRCFSRWWTIPAADAASMFLDGVPTT
jgi:hypothetical protein